jgi:hypothetical protein
MNTNKRALRNVGMVWLAIGLALVAGGSAAGWLVCVVGLTYLVEMTGPSEVRRSSKRRIV